MTVSVPAVDPLLYADLAVLEEATVAQDSGGTVTIQVAAEHWATVRADLEAAGVEVEDAPEPVAGCSVEFATEAIQRVKAGQPLMVTGPGPARLLRTVLTALDGDGRAAVVALGGLPGELVATTVSSGRPHVVGTPESLLGVHPLTGQPGEGVSELQNCTSLLLFGIEHVDAEPLEALFKALRGDPQVTRLKLIAIGDPSSGAGTFLSTAGLAEARFEDRVYAVRPDDRLLWRLWGGGAILAGEIAKVLPEAGSVGDRDCEIVLAGPTESSVKARLWAECPGAGGDSEIERPTPRQKKLLARLESDVAELCGPEPLAAGMLVQLLGPAGAHAAGTVARLISLDADHRCTVAIGEERVVVAPSSYGLSMSKHRAGKGRGAGLRRREAARLQTVGVRGVQPVRLPRRGGALLPSSVRLVLPTAEDELDAGELLRLRGCGGRLVRRGPAPTRVRPHGAVQRCRELLAIPSRDYAVERVAPTASGTFERYPYEDVFAKQVEVPKTFVPLCELYVRAKRFHEQQEQRYIAAAEKRQNAAVHRSLKKRRCCRNVDRDAKGS